MSKFASRVSDARKKFRPILPKPLMPTLSLATAGHFSQRTEQPPGEPTAGVSCSARGFGQTVDRAELPAQVAHVGLGIDRAAARRPLERLGRRERPAVPVQVDRKSVV